MAKKSIDAFQDTYRFLSNFWRCSFCFMGFEWSSVEQAYQALKMRNEEDFFTLLHISSPAEAKRLGGSLPKRDDWEDVKVPLMLDLVRAKFRYNPDLAKKLLETGDAELIEGNFHRDDFWGVYQGQGENHLGRILMQVRTELTEKTRNIQCS